MKALNEVIRSVAVAGVLIAVAGCGGGDSGGTSTSGGSGSSAKVSRAAPTEQQIIDGLKLTTDDNGLTYKSPEGCEVAQVMSGAGTVETYRSAGDTVATNRDGTAGVKLVAQPASCVADLSRKLDALG